MQIHPKQHLQTTALRQSAKGPGHCLLQQGFAAKKENSSTHLQPQHGETETKDPA